MASFAQFTEDDRQSPTPPPDGGPPWTTAQIEGIVTNNAKPWIQRYIEHAEFRAALIDYAREHIVRSKTDFLRNLWSYGMDARKFPYWAFFADEYTTRRDRLFIYAFLRAPPGPDRADLVQDPGFEDFAVDLLTNGAHVKPRLADVSRTLFGDRVDVIIGSLEMAGRTPHVNGRYLSFARSTYPERFEEVVGQWEDIERKFNRAVGLVAIERGFEEIRMIVSTSGDVQSALVDTFLSDADERVADDAEHDIAPFGYDESAPLNYDKLLPPTVPQFDAEFVIPAPDEDEDESVLDLMFEHIFSARHHPPEAIL